MVPNYACSIKVILWLRRRILGLGARSTTTNLKVNHLCCNFHSINIDLHSAPKKNLFVHESIVYLACDFVDSK